MSKSVFNSLCARWRGMSVMGRIVAIGAVCVSVLYGGAKGERGSGNAERVGACSQGKREAGIGKSVLSETNPQAIPTNVNMSSSRARSWSIRGAWDDVFTLKFENGFCFPYGTNLYKAVKVFSQGYVIPFTNPYTSSVLADIGSRVSIIPRLSTFFYEYTLSNSYRFVWNNVPIGRHSITNPESPQLNDFSLELLRSGDVVVSSNGVVRTVERTLPFDWDRDGIINERDDEPTLNNGNHFGNDNILPDGANSNNYCWVDIVVSNSISRVTFIGDGESNYPDPDFVALPNVAYRVFLLIGKTYEVLCNEPIVIANKSSNEIIVVSNADKPLKIVWPVTYEIESAARSLARSVKMNPSFVSGRFSWSTNACCVSENQNSATVPLCDDTCECQGCSQFGFTFHYEGYKLSFDGIECGCKENVHGESTQDGAFLNVSFSHSALFYEEAYTNEPGDVVERRTSTNVIITCTVKGGAHGGVLNLTRSGFDKLLFVSGDQISEESITLAPNETRVWEGVYAPLMHSEVKDDVFVSASFNEYMSGNVLSDDEKLTVVKLELFPQVIRSGCETRHNIGVREVINCSAMPDIGQWINTKGGEFSEHGVYRAPLISDGDELRYIVNKDYYNFMLDILEPSVIIARSIRVCAFALQENVAGGIGMELEIYVLPETVSFSGIAMQEIPSTKGVHNGYFSNLYFTDDWYHTADKGAGDWSNVKPDNFWDIDEAIMGDGLPLEKADGSMTWNLSEGLWRDGMIVWYIPWGWRDRNAEQDDLPVKTLETYYNQSFTINSTGTLSVSKFGNIVSRGTNNVIRLNGCIVK